MPRFRVYGNITCYTGFQAIVEAKDEQEARQIAERDWQTLATDSDGAPWQPDADNVEVNAGSADLLPEEEE